MEEENVKSWNAQRTMVRNRRVGSGRKRSYMTGTSPGSKAQRRKTGKHTEMDGWRCEDVPHCVACTPFSDQEKRGKEKTIENYEQHRKNEQPEEVPVGYSTQYS